MDHDLTGMDAAGARKYILEFITTLKLTEMDIDSLEKDAARWKNRAVLARSQDADGLVKEAESELEKVNLKLPVLREEERTLKGQIAAMRRQLPGLAARERSIDADLLEQELLTILGRTEEEAKMERAFQKLEKDKAADTALEALKARMKEN